MGVPTRCQPARPWTAGNSAHRLLAPSTGHRLGDPSLHHSVGRARRGCRASPPWSEGHAQPAQSHFRGPEEVPLPQLVHLTLKSPTSGIWVHPALALVPAKHPPAKPPLEGAHLPVPVSFQRHRPGSLWAPPAAQGTSGARYSLSSAASQCQVRCLAPPLPRGPCSPAGRCCGCGTRVVGTGLGHPWCL